jgi:hypothetical protein
MDRDFVDGGFLELVGSPSLVGALKHWHVPLIGYCCRLPAICASSLIKVRKGHQYD